MVEGREAGCAPLRNTAKPHCHRELLFLKLTWEPAEGLVYNQVCKERSTWRQAGGRRSHLPGHCAPSGDTGQEGAVTGVGSSLGMRGILSTNPWAQEQEDEPLPFTGLQTTGVCQRGVGHQEASQGCLLPVTGNCKPPRAQAGLRDLVISSLPAPTLRPGPSGETAGRSAALGAREQRALAGCATWDGRSSLRSWKHQLRTQLGT